MDRGLAFFLKGDTSQAQTSFREAALLFPTNVTPLLCLMFAEFELGNYARYSLIVPKALQMLEDQGLEPSDQTRQEILRNLACMFLYSMKLDEAISTLSKLSPGEARYALETSLSRTQLFYKDFPAQKKLRCMILDRLPRYRPTLQDNPEYFPIAHKVPETIISKDMFLCGSNGIACLFCGIGDMRDVLLTLIYAGAADMRNPSKKEFHFTLVDHNPAVLARTLLLFQLLFEADKYKTRSQETFVVLSYMFGAQVMPQWAFTHLRGCMLRVILRLNNHRTDIMDIFYIPLAVRSKIGHCLVEWMKNPKCGSDAKEILNLFPLPRNHSSRPQAKKDRPSEGYEASFAPEFEDSTLDVRCFRELGVMLPPMDLIAKYEPLLYHSCRELRRNSKLGLNTVKTKIASNWKPNITLAGSDFEVSTESWRRPFLDFCPHEVVRYIFGHVRPCLVGQNHSIMRQTVAFFMYVAQTFLPLQSSGRVTIEFVNGEMADTFDRIHHGLLREQYVKFAKLDPTTFPKCFESIHMSNVPLVYLCTGLIYAAHHIRGHTSGPLTTLLHGRPLLLNTDSSKMMIRVLHNTTMWTTSDQYLSEHLLLGKKSQRESHFGVKLAVASRTTEGAPISPMMGEKGLGYNAELIHEFPLPRGKLMARQELVKWLHAHFLKLCLPFPRSTSGHGCGLAGQSIAPAPLTLITFFHLVSHLFSVGYPAHWLSQILSDLCAGEMSTTARAPNTLITGAEQINHVYPRRTFCTQPFTAEFTTLLAIWRPLLGFGLVLDKEEVPFGLHKIKKFKITFPPHRPDCSDGLGASHFVLVLKKASFLVEKDLRCTLLDMNKTLYCPVHVISTFRWETVGSMATFWLDGGVVDGILVDGVLVGSEWEGYIWRSDDWSPVLGPVSLHKDQVLVCMEPWI